MKQNFSDKKDGYTKIFQKKRNFSKTKMFPRNLGNIWPLRAALTQVVLGVFDKISNSGIIFFKICTPVWLYELCGEKYKLSDTIMHLYVFWLWAFH